MRHIRGKQTLEQLAMVWDFEMEQLMYDYELLKAIWLTEQF